MKGLAILGSPHPNKNNAKLLKAVTTSIEKNTNIAFDYLNLQQLEIKPCSACGSCEHTKGCAIQDDMNNIYSKFNQARIILVAAPLYFNTVPAQLKALIDRCQALWASKYVLQDSLIDRKQQRLGAFISTAGQPRTKDRFKYVLGTMDLFFKAINATYYDNFLVGNIDQKPVTKRPQLLNQAQNWGEKIAQKL